MLTQNRQRLETQANELHRVSKQYTDTYDSVENIISERFAAFKQQLVQRELEARNALSALRDAGDVTLTTTRKAFLSRLNDVNVGLLRFRTLENNGADYEVLENRSKIHACANAEVPSIMGRGFQLTNIGDLVLTGLEVTLDLNSSDNRMESPAAKGRQPVANNNLQVAIQKSAPPPVPLRLTFPVDDNVQASVGEDGVFLRCVAKHGNGVQIGVRSRETLSSIINRYPRDNGNVSWQVRLENIKDTFLGVVEKTRNSAVLPDGFYWKPASNGITDGNIGRITPQADRLPFCKNGDLVRFLYNDVSQSLQVTVNNTNCGEIVTALNGNILACFIFFPGESLTLMF
ncbi:hypothetical protein, conserved [Angomonas deanei]|uniref:SPRY domain containing protein n=1 Tax=Angomonas deanei TaxID=59799 RepID=A0A7G2CDW0_9TRYP|nr:hypothetical protein, conserved [Angomonas deanei]